MWRMTGCDAGRISAAPLNFDDVFRSAVPEVWRFILPSGVFFDPEYNHVSPKACHLPRIRVSRFSFVYACNADRFGCL
ncbi:conserved hypothetical protein [Agrobacterium salinitolerans str. Hayward 0363]|nr:conserved hypothetical protein [Agrobacterium salinitolerans str. Hayward 0363]